MAPKWETAEEEYLKKNYRHVNHPTPKGGGICRLIV
jgi:hypothetical protein